MLALLALLVLCALITALELPGLASRRHKGEQLTFGVLLALGFGTGLALVLRWPVPNPTQVLEAIFGPVAALAGMR